MSRDFFSRLSHRRLLVKTKKRGMHKGARQSRAIGTSFDFSDYREYHLGDDVRQIDWNVFARTEKYYIKRFLDEQEIAVALYLDCTSSMHVDKKKWNLAKNIAASFAYMTLTKEDRLTFVPVGLELHQPKRRKGALYSKQMYAHISELKPVHAEHFIERLEQQFVKNTQLAIIITDGLEPLERFEALFKRIAPHCKQIRLLQILSNEELEPTFSSDMKLIDSENTSTVNVSMSRQIIDLYEQRMSNHNEKLSFICQRYGVSYLQVSDNEEIETIIFHKCVKSGWLE